MQPNEGMSNIGNMLPPKREFEDQFTSMFHVPSCARSDFDEEHYVERLSQAENITTDEDYYDPSRQLFDLAISIPPTVSKAEVRRLREKYPDLFNDTE